MTMFRQMILMWLCTLADFYLPLTHPNVFLGQSFHGTYGRQILKHPDVIND